MDDLKSNSGPSPFRNMDRVSLSYLHLKIWFTAGMGFFTDAYDLFVIGIVEVIIERYHLAGYPAESYMIPLVASSALLSAIIGQVIFGYLGDRIGRKTVYGIEAVILSVGALASALVPDLFWVGVFRFIQGIGIGGDYPISSTIMAEYSNAKDRGKMVSLVFANQGLGSITGVILGYFMSQFLPPTLTWRLLLGIGAIPALLVFYLRRRVPETPRYSLLVEGDVREAERAVRAVGAKLDGVATSREYGLASFIRKYGTALFITSSTWFLLDVAFYGTGVYSSVMVNQFFGKITSLSQTIFLSGLPYFVGLFGYFTSVVFMDILGRKAIQLQGFVVMGIIYLSVSYVIGEVASIPHIVTFLLYSLSFFFIDFGPNTTTFILPTELFPTRFRTFSHGISAAAGKAGAGISVLLFPSMLEQLRVSGLLQVLGVIAILGGVITAFIEEPKGYPLEEVSSEELVEYEDIK